MIDTAQEIRIGDLIQTRKPHPCGASEWTVTRTGADIKMRCSGCGRIVMLTREDFLKRNALVYHHYYQMIHQVADFANGFFLLTIFGCNDNFTAHLS